MEVRNDYNNTHYVFDLYVNFEFIIPAAVCDKISGFRVVRAERKEDDRRIIQQGLLNQTVQYGDANLGLEAGYGNTNFSSIDNNGFDDDPVFVNELNQTNPSPVEQPEYNTYLNGYLGLAENSHLAFYNKDYNNGAVTKGGNTNKRVFAWPETGDTKRFTVDQDRAKVIPKAMTPDGWVGPGSFSELHKHSSYFGSYDKRNQIKPGHGSYDRWGSQQRYGVSGSIFTLDSPDSAFGIRPYVFREGDILRIDSVLKLSAEERYEPDGPWSWNSNYPGNFYSHQEGPKVGSAPSTAAFINFQWKPNYGDVYPGKSDIESLKYASKRNIDDNYGVLIGKYYCFDPYFGIGMELDGGRFAAEDHANTVGAGSGFWTANRSYGYGLPLSAAKEIVDGEIVPTGFFKKSPRMKTGQVAGFSNNTLGFVKTIHNEQNSTNMSNPYTQSKTRGFFIFDAVYKGLSKWNGVDGGTVWGATGDTAWSGIRQKKDFNYDTISTMQMGLRSILLEVNTKVSEVKTSGYFESRDDIDYYSDWFACPDLSTIYEQQDWFGVYPNDGSASSGSGNTQINAGYGQSALNHPPVMRATTSMHLEDANISDREVNGEVIGEESQRGKDYHPHKFLCTIVRRTIPYGGWSKESIEATRYIPCGNFHPVSATVNPGPGDKRQGHLSQVFGGDTFVNFYSHQKTSTPYMKKSCARWQVFPVESYVNTDMRSGLALTNGDAEIGKEINTAPFSNDWFYNAVYSQENNTKGALMIDEDQAGILDLPYEIAYSNTKILGQSGDAFRQFPINQFHNMEGLYGEINRLVNFKNEIYVLQDNSFAKLLVNPLSVLSDDDGNSLFTGTGETVENHIYISTKFGTRHKFSVAQSESALYFVDCNFARVFKYDTDKLISLGDSLGQRNYLRNIIKDWEKIPHRICSSGSGGGGGVSHVGGNPVLHGTYYGELDSTKKPTNDREYFSDNHLKLLGIYSVFDFENKELLITFHNSAWNSENHSRQTFARPEDNHSMGSTANGQPVGVSETLVYSEAIDAFVSKYSVAPPQWLSGGNGSFLLCPENEISVYSIANIGSYDHLPYSTYGSRDSDFYKNYRCNPLRLWIWNKHDEKKKTHFFGKKDDVVKNQSELSPIDNTTTYQAAKVYLEGDADSPDESYIEKVISNDAGNSKVFDNSRIVMTPKDVPFSNVEFYTETSAKQELIINRRWNFNDTHEGWHWHDGSGIAVPGVTSTVLKLEATGSDPMFKSPTKGDLINLDGKYNYLIRAKIKKLSGSTWEGNAYWSGYNILDKENGNYIRLGESGSRRVNISEPSGILSDHVIAEWDMRGSSQWEESIIERIRLDFCSNSGSEIRVQWIEIGGLSASRYDDGILKFPLRTEESIRRTRGTWAKIKYSAKTTDKFNIFAILAKYRELFNK